MDELNKLVDAKLAVDTEFQTTISALSDEDKNISIENKRKELLDSEFNSLKEKADKTDKAEETAKNQEIRAKKAEGELKKVKPPEKKEDGSLSTKDFYALTKANIPEDDIDDVADYAKFKGITISEALNSSVVKSTLAEKAETRRVAQATTTRSTRSQNSAIDGNEIMKNIRSKGEDAIPEPGSKEAEALFDARHKKSS